MSDLLQTVRGCTFDDFLFTPQYSVVERRDPATIDLSSRFSEHLTLKRPLVSANMDTITRAEMAIAVAEEGGIGIIDRGFRSGDIEPQVREVERVKRRQHGVMRQHIGTELLGQDVGVADHLRQVTEALPERLWIDEVMLLNERTWLFTLLFSTLTLEAILGLREGKGGRWCWLLPALYVLWANLHIQFIYGLFILVLACAAPCLDRLLGRGRPWARPDTFGSRDWWRLIALTGACLAATLLNPYHVRLYAVVVEYATQPVAFRLVSEHRAMDFRGPVDWAVLAMAGGLREAGRSPMVEKDMLPAP